MVYFFRSSQFLQAVNIYNKYLLERSVTDLFVECLLLL